MNDAAPMPRHRLGNSSVEVTELGLGGGPIGGLLSFVPTGQARATVQKALRHGIGYIDTAPLYGAGRSETVIGQTLAGMGGGSSGMPGGEVVLSTKVGRHPVPLAPGAVARHPLVDFFVDPLPYDFVWDWSRDGVRRTLEGSLSRLGRDRMDVVYLHDPDDHEHEVYETAFPALAELRDEGVVGAIGAGMTQTAMLTRLVDRLDLDVVLCAGRYSLLDRSAEAELLPACRRRGTSVVAGGVFNSGVLARPDRGATYDYTPAPDGVLRRAQQLGRVCADFGVPLRAAAIQFPLRRAEVVSVLVGCRTPEEVADNVAMSRLSVPDGLWRELDAVAGTDGQTVTHEQAAASSPYSR